MKMFKVVKGDMISLAAQGEFDVIVHGCNCFHTMGAGLAKQIKDRLPVAYAADMGTPYGDINKLGSFSVAERINGNSVLTIVNAYTQFEPGPNAEYSAIKEFLRNFFCKEMLRSEVNTRYAFPLIGCGIGGLDETQVIPMIEAYSATFDITLVVFE
jgi:O-acetyl-ADP-ribose deacetylase (regulator of RNase III)